MEEPRITPAEDLGRRRASSLQPAAWPAAENCATVLLRPVMGRGRARFSAKDEPLQAPCPGKDTPRAVLEYVAGATTAQDAQAESHSCARESPRPTRHRALQATRPTGPDVPARDAAAPRRSAPRPPHRRFPGCLSDPLGHRDRHDRFDLVRAKRGGARMSRRPRSSRDLPGARSAFRAFRRHP